MIITDAVAIAQLARVAQIFHRRANRAAVPHDGLDEERGDVVSVRLEDVLQAVGVVERHHVQQLLQHRRHAGAVGHGLGIALRGIPVAHRRVPQGGIEDAVISALDDDVGVLAGEGARETQRSHHRFGTGIREAHALGGWHHARDALRDGVLALGREREDSAHFHARARRGVDPRIRIAEDARPVGHAIVDVLVAVDVPYSGAARLADVERLLVSPVAEVRRDAQRKPGRRALEMGVAACE
jgi:hypothetical protein